MINFICPVEPPTTAQSPPPFQGQGVQKVVITWFPGIFSGDEP